MISWYSKCIVQVGKPSNAAELISAPLVTEVWWNCVALKMELAALILGVNHASFKHMSAVEGCNSNVHVAVRKWCSECGKALG